MYLSLICVWRLFLVILLRGTAAGRQVTLNEETNHDQANATNPLNENFRKFTLDIMGQFDVPGVSIAVVDGVDTFEDAYGFSSLPDVKATPDSLYYVGSLTKGFTAAALMMLLEDSANTLEPLSLTTKISSLVPGDFVTQDEYATAHATLEDALTHRLGFPSHEVSYGGESYTPRDATRSLRHLHMNSELRTRFQYFNMGYMVLQHVIQTITGSWIGDLHQTRIWNPLSMNNTYIRLEDALTAVKQGKAVLANGYSKDLLEEKLLEQPWTDTLLVGEGGIISSVRDFAKYLRAMIDMKLPLSHLAQEELIRPRIIEGQRAILPWSGIIGYALGWNIAAYRDHQLITHTGSIMGFATRLAYLPSKKWGVILMANADESGSSCIDNLFMHLLDDYLAVPEDERKDLVPQQKEFDKIMLDMYLNARIQLYPDIPQPTLPHSLPLGSYAGTYENPGYQTISLEVKKPSSRLPVADSRKPVLHGELDRLFAIVVDLEHVSGEYFVAYVETQVPSEVALLTCKAEFRIGADGKVHELGIQGEVLAGDEPVWFRRVD
ncbi:hypothetical protein MMC10_008391 [Thelotrema lepadinum]|nr:hypothetical protein [Thelotrema lepadinum]